MGNAKDGTARAGRLEIVGGGPVTDFSRPADGRHAESPDVLGFISLGLGLVSTLGCLGSCIPYLGTLLMALSWMTTILGVITGAAGVVVRKQAEASPVYSGAGLALNLVVIALWIAYFVFVFGLLAVLFGSVLLLEA
jgi:hypothetical protein